jgi:putative aminopeptidase FrvX
MTIELVDLLKELSAAVGISGYEQTIRDILRRHYAPYVDEFVDDPLGSLTMIKRGQQTNGNTPRRKIMLAAHTDEIGAMVIKIDRGFIHFTSVGGLDKRLLLGQEVTVFGRQVYHGVIASRPPHFASEDRDKYPDISDYQIDLGLPSEVVAENVRVGDLIALKKTPQELMGGLITGKAMDDRASVAAIYICLKELSRLTHNWDVYAVATSQEEVGLKGAFTSAYRINPDAAIAIDVTFADAPGIVNEHEVSLSKGPVIGVGANVHPVMGKRLQETAAALEMSVQAEYYPAGTGTDAWAIQISQSGIPTGLISVPLRYMHSPIETASVKDVERVGRLMAYFIADLTEAFINDLTPKEGLED